MVQHLCIKLIKKLPRIFLLQPIHNIKTSKYSISIRGSYIWNSFLSPEEKQITTMSKFKAITKSRLFFLENELLFF